MPVSDAVRLVREASGTHFDPAIVELVARLHAKRTCCLRDGSREGAPPGAGRVGRPPGGAGHRSASAAHAAVPSPALRGRRSRDRDQARRGRPPGANGCCCRGSGRACASAPNSCCSTGPSRRRRRPARPPRSTRATGRRRCGFARRGVQIDRERDRRAEARGEGRQRTARSHRLRGRRLRRRRACRRGRRGGAAAPVGRRRDVQGAGRSAHRNRPEDGGVLGSDSCSHVAERSEHPRRLGVGSWGVGSCRGAVRQSATRCRPLCR